MENRTDSEPEQVQDTGIITRTKAKQIKAKQRGKAAEINLPKKVMPQKLSKIASPGQQKKERKETKPCPGPCILICHLKTMITMTQIHPLQPLLRA